MGGSGSALFTDPDDYQANLPPTTHLLALQPGHFQAPSSGWSWRT
jgi:hypothetical protein